MRGIDCIILRYVIKRQGKTMEFFANMTTTKIIGLIMLAVGALLSFAAKRITARCEYKNAEMICRFLGFGIAITGFLIIFI